MCSALRVAYFGLPLGACLLHGDGHELSLVVLSPIEAPGRRRTSRLFGSAVLDALEGPQDLDDLIDRRLLAQPVDLIVSWFWTRRLPERWLSHPRLGAIGAHPSLLPRHRGPNPYYAAIDCGDAESGVTIHRLTPEYDEGDVLLQGRVPVGERNSWQLARALDRPALSLLREVAQRLAAGESLPAKEQAPDQVTWAPEPEGDALRADFAWDAARVLRRLRALSPVPGLALEVAGLPFFATRARLTTQYPNALVAGEAAVNEAGTLVIRCADSGIAIERAVAAADEEHVAEGTDLDERTLGRLVAARLARRG